MKAAAVCFTETGAQTMGRIRDILEAQHVAVEAVGCGSCFLAAGDTIKLEKPLREWTGQKFQSCDVLIFIGAAGIAVRSIAPYLQSKTTDPAVLVVDEKGTFVISLLSGHIGGANRFCTSLAEYLGAVPVITTATDLNGKFAVDVFAGKNGMWIQSMAGAKEISAAILRGEKIAVRSDFPIEGKMPEELLWAGEKSGSTGRDRKEGTKVAAGCGNKEGARTAAGCGNKEGARTAAGYGNKEGARTAADAGQDSCAREICISWNCQEGGGEDRSVLYLVPRTVVLGIGCKKGKTCFELEQAVLDCLVDLQVSIHAVKKICSIEVKAQEQGLLELCAKYRIPFETYTAEALQQVEGKFSASAFVHSQVGVDNVCERSAVLGSGGGRLIQKKKACGGITVAAAYEDRRICFE